MIAHSEVAMKKSYNVYKMNLEEQEQYQTLNQRIGNMADSDL